MRMRMMDVKGVSMLKVAGMAIVLALTCLVPIKNASADLLHNSADTGSTKWSAQGGWGVPGGKYGEFTCDTCHEPNNKANIKNIRTVISSPDGTNLPNGAPSVNVVFRNVTSQGDDTTAHASSSRICEVCHSANKFHNSNTANNTAGLGHPTPKQQCTNCHVHNTGFKAACGGCHGNPPTEAVLGGDTGLIGTPRASNALEPGRVGAHYTHTNPEMRNLVCDTCHYIDNGTTKMPSQSGTIQIGFFGFGGKVTTGTYTPYTSATRGYPFSSGTPNTTIASAVTTYAAANKCSNVYCHGGGSTTNGKSPLTALNAGAMNQAPRWDGTSQSACGSCHGATAANPPTMGNHVKHAGSATGYGYSCDFCHPATDISHVQGNVRWQLNVAEPRIGAGAGYQAYGSGVSTATGSTGDMAPSANYGQCSNIYCHQSTTPTWGASLPADCTGCHGNDEWSANPMQKNAHKAHVYNRSARFDHFDFKCQECHNNTVDATGRAISNRANHVNMTKDVSWGATATRTSGTVAYNGTGASCATTYCHSNGTGGAPNVTPENWTTVADGTEGNYSCNSCHGGFEGEPNPMNTARHYNHITTSPTPGIKHAPIRCDKCHDMTVGPDGQSIDHENGLHINKSFNVTFAKFANRSGNYVTGTKTCQNTYCHGRATNAVWTSTTVNACGACHRANNSTSSGLSNAHIRHYGTSTIATNDNGWTSQNLSLNTNVFTCGVCHSVNPDTNHVNGPAMPNGAAAEVVINLPFTVTPSSRNYPADGVPVINRGTTVVPDGANYYYSQETTCSVYCHSNGRGGAPVVPKAWAGTATACGNCHNKAGDASPTWSGAHTKHITSAVSTAATCNACHARTASGNNTLITNQRQFHPNGFVNISGGALTGQNLGIMRFNGTNCTNVYCHYNQPTPNWEGGTLAANCSGCHGGTVASGSPIGKWGHKAHINNQSAKFNGFNFKCVECHSTTVNGTDTIISTTLHVNGTNNVAWGPASTGGGAYSAGNCSQVYCHSRGTSTSSPVYTPPLNWRSMTDNTEGTASCDYCHKGVAGDFKIMSSARHYNHVVQSPSVGIRHAAVGCDKCHDQTVGPDGMSIDPANSRHISRTIDISFFKFSNRSGSWVSGTKTCNVTYCHGGANPRWTTTTINNCGSCHAASSSTTRALSPTHAKHYATTTNITKTVGWDNSNVSTATGHIFRCGVCHNVYPETDHVSGPITQNGAAAQVAFNIPLVPAGASRPNTVNYGTGHVEDGGGYFYSTGTTCDVYCHSDGRGGPSKTQFVWTSTVFSCGQCHNSQGDGAASPTWSPAHTKHIRGYAEGGNPNFGCQVCHTSTTTTGTTIASKIVHNNGARDVVSSTYGNFTYDSGTKGCSANYCHSEGRSTTSPYTQISTITWETAGPLTCNSCHTGGLAGSTQGPTYTTGKANSHAKHVFTCDTCHGSVVNAAGVIVSPTLHVNKAYNLQAGSGTTFTVTTQGTPTTPTVCSTVSCHGDGTARTWGQPLTCAGCHDYDTVGATYTAGVWSGGYWGKSAKGAPDGFGAHAKHINYIKSRLGLATALVAAGQTFAQADSENIKVCGTCHSNLATDHMNGSRQVFTQTTGTHPFALGGSGGTSLQFVSGTNPTYNTSARTCSNLSCHYFTSPVW